MTKYPWSKKKYRKILSHYHPTQADAADMLGVDLRSVQRWAKDGPPFLVCLVYLLMIRYDLTSADINRLAHKWLDHPNG